MSQPSPPSGESDANAAYLAAFRLGATASPAPAVDSTAPATGPQPVPLPSDGGPLGTAPSSAMALPQGDHPGLDLAPDGRGDFGAPMHRI
ncbi:hypothetical protein FJ656_14265 [Schumannella luteola]|nr:hypothetical protein FJ656_14265 [Schumannella luteola]